jgi:hypothetical protein
MNGSWFDDDREYRSDGACVECGEASHAFCICGAPLCTSHFERQAGFCSSVTDEEHGRIVDTPEI